MATNTRKQQSSRPAPEEEALEPARTQGMLMEVNWRERRGSNPFSREELLEEIRTNPKPFIPGDIPRMDIPEEEMEEFRRVIREARNV